MSIEYSLLDGSLCFYGNQKNNGSGVVGETPQSQNPIQQIPTASHKLPQEKEVM